MGLNRLLVFGSAVLLATCSGSPTAPTVPAIVAPASGSTNQPAALTIKAGRVAAASRYQWQVSVLPTFVTFVVNDSTADTTYAGQFTGGQTFYLRVRGMNDLGQSAFSAIDTFTVMTPPARTTLLLPANNAQNVISAAPTTARLIAMAKSAYHSILTTPRRLPPIATGLRHGRRPLHRR